MTDCTAGGLACAIACRRENLDVLMLEKAEQLNEIGAGIQLPPNASRIMSDWNLLDKLYTAGCSVRGETHTLRWQDGKKITTRPGEDWAREKFGHAWQCVCAHDIVSVWGLMGLVRCIEQTTSGFSSTKPGDSELRFDSDATWPLYTWNHRASIWQAARRFEETSSLVRMVYIRKCGQRCWDALRNLSNLATWPTGSRCHERLLRMIRMSLSERS